MAQSHRILGRRWRELVRQVFNEETHCYWCGGYVDQTLPRTHPMSRTVDHVIEIHEGGHPLDRDNASPTTPTTARSGGRECPA